jgi:type I restriction enzyme, S subunit
MIATALRHEALAKIENPWQPAHNLGWRFVQVKVGYDITLGKMLHNEATSPEDLEVPYLKSQHVQWDKVILQSLPTMWASPWEVKILRVRTGDLLVCEGGDVGRAGIVTGAPPENCIIQNALHLARAKHGNSTHFLRYLLQNAASHKWFEVLCNRATIAHFTAEKFNQMWVWLPTPEIQHQIVDYLDRETQKIDALIAAQKRLLELLGEKRRSLITHAVTRGLTADVSMRDSGIQWLGEIPGHWTIQRVKFLIFGIEGGFSPQCYGFPPNEGEWGVLKSGCVNGGVFNPYESKTLPEKVEPSLELEVCQGDILMSRASGSVELIGSVALVEEQPKARLLLSDKTFRLSLNSDVVDANFFVAVMGSLIVRQQIKQVISGAEGLANNIAQSDIRELLIPLPPLLEQKEIINTLNKKTGAIDHLSNTSIKIIALLQERRTSLISAAVTGQLQIAD